MSQLPNGWINTSLGDVLAIRNGYAFKSTNFIEKGIPLVRQANLAGNTVDLTKAVYLPESFLEEYQRFKLQSGDILMGMSGSIGKLCIYDQDQIALQNQRTGKIELFSKSDISERYVWHFLKTIESHLSDKAKGIAVANVSAGDIESTPFPLAPLNEQKRIADKLDAVLVGVDACRERLDRVPAILKRFRQSVLAAATSGKLTEEWRDANPSKVGAAQLVEKVHGAHESAGGHKAGNAAPPTEDVHDLSADMFPHCWALLTLRDLVLPDRPITYGILKPGPELESGVSYVRVADFPNERLNLSTIRRTSREIDQEFKRSRLRNGDLLLSIRGTVGRLIVIPVELDGANITQDSARLSIQPSVNRDFVLWYLRSDLAQARMKDAIKGVAVRGINIGDVRALQVPLPSREEQNEIVRRVEVLFAYADRLEARYTAARAQVERLTPALLAKAFRGELVPQDPNDEPAAMLLERIRNEKENHRKQK